MQDRTSNLNETPTSQPIQDADLMPGVPTTFGDRHGRHQQVASTHARKPRFLNWLRSLLGL